MIKSPTPNQQELLQRIQDFYQEHRRYPLLRELASHYVTSKANISLRLIRLKNNGLLNYNKGIAGLTEAGKSFVNIND
jgi:Mn-dependent DtxR family transcriptional regulator